MTNSPSICSLPKYRWVYREKRSSEAQVEAKALASELNISQLLARVLIARGMNSPEKAKTFLYSSKENLYPAESMPGLEKARDRLITAIENREQVMVHGDYDADGISGAVILHKTLKDLGCKSRIFLPERSTHGYGLAPQAVEKAHKAGIKLIVTVDCGISSGEVVKTAVDSGIEVIVTDHHPIPDYPPEDVIIVHPEIESGYAGGKVSGAVVAWKLAMSLLTSKGKNSEYIEDLYLPLAAVATVADVCELTGENRTIVALGLPKIRNSPLPGLRILCEGICNGSDITERDIAFGMAPLLNSAGRMGDPLPAARLLLAQDEDSAWKYFRKLEQINVNRRKFQSEITSRLREKSASLLPSTEEGQIIVLIDENCTPGIAGLVASMLAEETGLPSCVLAPCKDIDGSFVYRGSMRTSKNEDLRKLMDSISDCAERIGGHAQAIGLTVRPECLDDFLEACRNIRVPAAQTELELDFELGKLPSHVESIKDLDRTRPWGRGNPQPIFSWGPVMIKEVKTVGTKMQHVQLHFHGPEGEYCKGIGFNMAKNIPETVLGSQTTAAGHLQVNSWQGTDSIEIHVRDLDFRNQMDNLHSI